MSNTNVVPMPAPQAVTNIAIDREAVLRHLGLDPRQAATQALVLVCEQYKLDPVLKHLILIQNQPYVTHKGLWHLAHRSEQLDGWEVVDQGETETEWWAKVSIRRKDMSGAFTMVGRYPKSGTNKAHGPEMAVTRADCLILRRMFDVSLTAAEEIDFDQAPPQIQRPAAIDVGTGEIIDTDPIAPEKWRNGWFAAANKAGIKEDEERHAIVHYATGGRTSSIAQVRASETKAVKEATDAYSKGDLVLTFDAESDLPTLTAKVVAGEPQPPAEPVQPSFAPGEEPF